MVIFPVAFGNRLYVFVNNPARKVYSHRDQLVVSNPNAWRARRAPGFNSEIACRANEHFFERPHVPGNVAPVLGEIENRITHQLAGSMIGYVSAAVGVENLSAPHSEPLGGHQHILRLGIAAERVHMWMLQQ